MNNRLTLVQDDITAMKVDAIVNAANSSLLGGGGVDGAIHRAAGPDLLEACRKLNGCKTGEAKLTEGFKLPAKFIIHTVGPVWHGGRKNEAVFLASCYQKSLELAIDNNCETIAFPNISTGVYGFPKDKACAIAVDTIKDFLTQHQLPGRIFFVCFDDENYRLYKAALDF